MTDEPPKPLSKADQYRKRGEALSGHLKLRRPDRDRLERKRRALEDMAANEDWLDGKPGSQLKK